MDFTGKLGYFEFGFFFCCQKNSFLKYFRIKTVDGILKKININFVDS
jgi:hypothetical protein